VRPGRPRVCARTSTCPHVVPPNPKTAPHAAAPPAACAPGLTAHAHATTLLLPCVFLLVAAPSPRPPPLTTAPQSLVTPLASESQTHKLGTISKPSAQITGPPFGGASPSHDERPHGTHAHVQTRAGSNALYVSQAITQTRRLGWEVPSEWRASWRGSSRASAAWNHTTLTIPPAAAVRRRPPAGPRAGSFPRVAS